MEHAVPIVAMLYVWLEKINKYSYSYSYSVPEIIDPVFAKTSQNARFLLSENERFGLVFVKTGSINSGTGFEISKILLKNFYLRVSCLMRESSRN